MSLHIVPCTVAEANAHVARYHRHHGPVVMARLAFAVADDSGLVHGVVLVTRPVARHLDDGWTLEVSRCCTDGTQNACSALYGAAWRSARAIGYTRLITYTLPEEGGASLRAAGWQRVCETKGDQWNRPGRARKENPLYLLNKHRWEVTVNTTLPFSEVTWPAPEVSAQPTLFDCEVNV